VEPRLLIPLTFARVFIGMSAGNPRIVLGWLRRLMREGRYFNSNLANCGGASTSRD